MSLFSKRCSHKWFTDTRSNAIQLDDMGYPLRLFICKCQKCGEYEQMWLDVPVEEAEELKTGKSVLVQWF